MRKQEFEFCYNCGDKLVKATQTREHIPSKNLFEGFRSDSKKNRITVPACLKCNSDYSYIDEEFRNFIAVINKYRENIGVVEKAERGFYRKQCNHDRVVFLNANQTGVKFDGKIIDEYHIKNFKGLYYYLTGKPILNYSIYPYWDENDKSEKLIKLLSYLTRNFNWKYSGNPDIFRFILQPFRENLTNPDKMDISIKENEPFFLGIIEYNKLHATLILAEKNDFNNQ